MCNIFSAFQRQIGEEKLIRSFKCSGRRFEWVLKGLSEYWSLGQGVWEKIEECWTLLPNIRSTLNRDRDSYWLGFSFANNCSQFCTLKNTHPSFFHTPKYPCRGSPFFNAFSMGTSLEEHFKLINSEA